MTSLKSLLINAAISLLFTVAFTAFFAAVSIYFLPGDYQELRFAAEHGLPDRILNDAVVRQQIDQQLPWKDMGDKELQATIHAFAAQCDPDAGENFSRRICVEAKVGRISDRQDLRRFIREEVLRPQITAALQKAFTDMQATVRESERWMVPLVFLFFIAFAAASGALALESGFLEGRADTRHVLHAIADSTWSYSFSTFIPLLILWLALPYITPWLLQQIQGPIASQVANTNTGNPEQAVAISQELVQVVGQFMIDIIRKTMVRPMAVSGLVAAAGWIGRRLTRDPVQK